MCSAGSETSLASIADNKNTIQLKLLELTNQNLKLIFSTPNSNWSTFQKA